MLNSWWRIYLFLIPGDESVYLILIIPGDESIYLCLIHDKLDFIWIEAISATAAWAFIHIYTL